MVMEQAAWIHVEFRTALMILASPHAPTTLLLERLCVQMLAAQAKLSKLALLRLERHVPMPTCLGTKLLAARPVAMRVHVSMWQQMLIVALLKRV
jgi:hypothetical protein